MGCPSAGGDLGVAVRVGKMVVKISACIGHSSAATAYIVRRADPQTALDPPSPAAMVLEVGGVLGTLAYFTGTLT